MNNKLPTWLYKYFWDIKPQSLDIKKKAYYVNERLLEYGDLRAVKWLIQTYKPDFLKNVVTKSKKLSKKSALFYALVLNIKKNKILCLQKDFQNKHRKIWRF